MGRDASQIDKKTAAKGVSFTAALNETFS